MYKSKLSTCIKAASLAAAVSSISVGSFAAIGYSSDFEGVTDLGAAGEGFLGWLNVSDGYAVDPSGNTITYPGNFKFGTPYAPDGGAAWNGQQIAAVITTPPDASGNTESYLNIYSHYDCCQDAGPPEGHFDDGTGQGGTEAFDALHPFYDSSRRDNVHANIFQEFNLVQEDLGSTITVTFDARLSQPDASGNDTYVGSGVNCASNTFDFGGCTAEAFIKIINNGLDAGSGGDGTFNFFLLDAQILQLAPSLHPTTWKTFTMTYTIPADVIGDFYQVGFANFSEQFGNTGMEVDNVVISQQLATNIPIPAFAIAIFGGLLSITGIRALRKRANG